MRVVVDTNVLLTSISRKSSTYWLFQSIVEKYFEIAYTTDILIEYEEQITRHWQRDVAAAVIQTIIELPNAIPVTVFYKLNLIEQDEDDNKFVDCAFAANAGYLITEDRHFDVLKNITFPSIHTVNIENFRQILINKNLLNPSL